MRPEGSTSYQDYQELYSSCRLCPRNCNISRRGGVCVPKKGFCGETDQLRVGYIGPHFGEEPPITGTNGSGTVFLSGCSLKCSFCQNHQISHHGLGTSIGPVELFNKIQDMIGTHHVHNINFVTPDHFFPHIFYIVSLLRKLGLDIPIVFNTSGYQSVEMLKHAEEHSDIYLPDYKYSDSSMAARLSKCPDYPAVALDAISEMLRQKGFLDACLSDLDIAKKGVLVRHLILPGQVENSINALTSLFLEFGAQLPISLMSQYHPVLPHADECLNRSVSKEEFDQVLSHANDLGFEHLFVQFPETGSDDLQETSPFLPDFRLEKPFRQ
ncbi:Radical SAM domain-containing protein [uncultured Desulfobacterium sp.]|uniref:Radical SAM domain-containing protein n=1 Tax=uncultured Desulfobacterium sp. TaxID=201089 RepID=A0A445MQK6_9BACT|nr:Radical SAM domain-containing protein [uncultured Desulfobacterium sp.]